MYPKYPMTQAGASGTTDAPSASTPASGPGRRIQVRRSGIHGRGVFAARPLAEGETVIEYKGEIISWKEALRRHPHDPANPDHTFYFHIDDKHVIDGKYDGNSARWMNHSCEPNCEAEQDGSRVFIKALREISAGEELFFDYGLILEERHTAKVKKQFECRCGSPRCRGTMLAPKR
jgi:SET domain-containing protein